MLASVCEQGCGFLIKCAVPSLSHLFILHLYACTCTIKSLVVNDMFGAIPFIDKPFGVLTPGHDLCPPAHSLSTSKSSNHRDLSSNIPFASNFTPSSASSFRLDS